MVGSVIGLRLPQRVARVHQNRSGALIHCPTPNPTALSLSKGCTYLRLLRATAQEKIGPSTGSGQAGNGDAQGLKQLVHRMDDHPDQPTDHGAVDADQLRISSNRSAQSSACGCHSA